VIRKQFAFGWQVFEQVQCFRAQVDNHRLAGFFAGETDGLARPVNILALQIGDVALTAAQMPAQLIKHFSFEIFFGGDDVLMLLKRDGALGFEFDGRPLAFRQNRGGKPIHVNGEIVHPPQISVHGNFAALQDMK